jgi:hypothetical protein
MRGRASALRRQASFFLACAVLLLASEPSAWSLEASKAPEFPHQDPSRWVGAPVRIEDLRGKVVLLDVWTFG